MTESDNDPEPLKLWELNGAVLVYEDRNGDEVRVEFED